MKRCFPVMVLIALILLGLSGQVLAADTEWKLKLNADRTITETVSMDQGQLMTYDNTWKVSQEDGRIVLNRNFPAWQVYTTEDRLPLQISVKDYFLWQELEIRTVAQQNGPAGVFSSVAVKPLRLIIQLPGAISSSSAERIEGNRTAIWQINKGAEVSGKGLLLETTLIDGFLVSILLFLLGFSIIAILFMRKIRNTHKLIEEEYSLENIDREHLQSDENLQTDEKDSEDKKE